MASCRWLGTPRTFFIGVFLFLVVATLVFIVDVVPLVRLSGGGVGGGVGVEVKSEGYEVDTAGCRIPALRALPPNIAPLVWPMPALECAGAQPDALVAANRTALFVQRAALAEHGVADVAALRCCYREVTRLPPSPLRDDHDQVSFSPACTEFSEAVAAPAEFVRVECRHNSREIYVDFFAFVLIKPHVEERCRRKSAERGNATGLNVLIIGLDSVSRINFHRQMKDTDATLRDLGAIEMFGYNKVGDNTYPNLLAALTGRTAEEAAAECLPRPPQQRTYDSCPFAWRDFADAGYRTAFAEDDFSIGAFNYLSRNGFVRPPTDYYLRPLLVAFNAARGTQRFDHDGKVCVADKANAQVLLDYAGDFALSMTRSPGRRQQQRRHLGVFWQSTVTHDALNDAQQLDARLADKLRLLSAAGALDHTALLVMSDHGLRFGAIRSTFQGWLEERLPLMTFTFPPWFLRAHAQAVANLRANARRLTTPLDLHATLADLRDLRRVSPSSLAGRGQAAIAARPRGQSLFLPVRASRTCQEAGVEEHWCTCLHTEPLDPAHPTLSGAADFVVSALNAALPSPRCRRLAAAGVAAARRQFPAADRDGLVGVATLGFVVVVTATPGGGAFEATLLRGGGGGGWQFAGGRMEVSRLDVYGNQSWCVDDPVIKMYCYCGDEPAVSLAKP